MKKTNFKGFTLVELLVVIAILAILATVSVVGYTSFIERAHMSNDTSLIHQLNSFKDAYLIGKDGDLDAEDINDILEQSGIDNLLPQSKQYGFFFNYRTQSFELVKLSEAEGKEYLERLPPEGSQTTPDQGENDNEGSDNEGTDSEGGDDTIDPPTGGSTDPENGENMGNEDDDYVEPNDVTILFDNSYNQTMSSNDKKRGLYANSNNGAINVGISYEPSEGQCYSVTVDLNEIVKLSDTTIADSSIEFTCEELLLVYSQESEFYKSISLVDGKATFYRPGIYKIISRLEDQHIETLVNVKNIKFDDPDINVNNPKTNLVFSPNDDGTSNVDILVLNGLSLTDPDSADYNNVTWDDLDKGEKHRLLNCINITINIEGVEYIIDSDTMIKEKTENRKVVFYASLENISIIQEPTEYSVTYSYLGINGVLASHTTHHINEN